MTPKYTAKQAVQEFWNKVKLPDVIGTDECWEWQGGKLPEGYGRVRFNDKSVLAHRISYEWGYGNLPTDMLVCHKCDNPSCVNPAHLFVGTHNDNYIDAKRKGRHKDLPVSRGTQYKRAKMTEETVAIARQLYSEGESLKCLANRFNVTDGNIRHIVNYKTWKHVK